MLTSQLWVLLHILKLFPAVIIKTSARPLSPNSILSDVNDNQPTCEFCRLPLIVKHIVVDCPNLDTRLKYFTVSSLQTYVNVSTIATLLSPHADKHVGDISVTVFFCFSVFLSVRPQDFW